MSAFVLAVLIVLAIFLAIGVVVPQRRATRAVANMRAVEDLRRRRS